MAQFKKERECSRVLGPWANQASTLAWVQVSRSVSCSRSQARSLHRDVGLRPHHRVATLGQIAGIGEGREPRAVMPTQIGGDEPALGGLFDGGQAALGPALVGSEVAVTLGQHAVGDEKSAQVLAPVGHGQGVETVMAERHRPRWRWR